MKLISFYLPQYHSIPENDEWWGKDFTEWTNVKNAKPVFKGHVQPKIPLNENYYNLLDDNTKIWQAKTAKEAGIYGFCYYHYWFNGKKLLEKPAEQMLENKDIDINFCFSWANEPWSRSWQGKTTDVLMPQSYGDKHDWIEHFEYLLPFFKDDRYIKENNKPIFIIYKPDIIPSIIEMKDCWDSIARENGFDGIYWGFQFPTCFRNRVFETSFDFGIEFEPLYTRMWEESFVALDNLRNKILFLKKHPYLFFRYSYKKFKNEFLNKPIVYDYVKTNQLAVGRAPYFINAVPGIFTGWDKTPRNGNKAAIYNNSSPEAFKRFLEIKIRQAKEIYHTDYLFVTAWNEWGEGAYLEPDEQYGMGYLNAVQETLKDYNILNEF